MSVGKPSVVRWGLPGILLTGSVWLFAGCGGSGPSSGEIPSFNGERAFSHLTNQVEIGSRVPGSPEHRLTMEYLKTALEPHADSLRVQEFNVSFEDTTIYLWNIVSHFKGTGEGHILLGAHWDTRAWSDEDPDPANRTLPIHGANDGASGVAVLLELARLMAETPPPRDVDIVLFDGEDQGGIAGLPWCMGSDVYARSLEYPKPDYALVVDMVGDRDLQIFMETHSRKYALHVVERVWKTAKDLGVTEFKNEARHTMYDDHVRLIDVGIPAAVIIDFDYPHWHTRQDTPDKCSAQSLDAVGRVVTAVVYGS
jgi:hypothetical protein